MKIYGNVVRCQLRISEFVYSGSWGLYTIQDYTPEVMPLWCHNDITHMLRILAKTIKHEKQALGTLITPLGNRSPIIRVHNLFRFCYWIIWIVFFDSISIISMTTTHTIYLLVWEAIKNPGKRWDLFCIKLFHESQPWRKDKERILSNYLLNS